jgi:nucleoside-diphosphate-sugar epimerase
VEYRVPDISLACRILGWKPSIDLREALRRTISSYVQDQQVALAELGRPDEL